MSRGGRGVLWVTSVRNEAKPAWGWIHVVSILIAVALHGLALYAVASLLNKPIRPQAPPTVVVRMETRPPAAPAAAPPAGAQPSASPPVDSTKNSRDATRPLPGQEILPVDMPASHASSVTSVAVPVEGTAPELEDSGTPAPEPERTTGVTLGAATAFFCPVRPAPVYPRVSRKMGEEGTVLLRVEWGPDGKIASRRVQKSSGFSRLDEAALAAIARWRCHPATQDGAPVSAVVLQPFSFGLEDE